jgi:hypothetical protein
MYFTVSLSCLNVDRLQLSILVVSGEHKLLHMLSGNIKSSFSGVLIEYSRSLKYLPTAL